MVDIFERYARLLVDNQVIVLFLAAAVIFGSLLSAQYIQTTAPQYDEMVPDDIPAVEALDFASTEFGTSSQSVLVVVQIQPRHNGTGIRDIRDPAVLRYIDVLSQKFETLPTVNDATSLVDLIEPRNNGTLPHTTTAVIEALQRQPGSNISTPDPVEVLGTSRTALQKIQSALQAQQQGLTNLSQGLLAQQSGLQAIKYNLGRIEDNLNQLEDAGDISQLLDVIDLTQQLVQASSATASEKQDILGNLTIVENGVEDLGEGLDSIEGAATRGTAAMDRIQTALERSIDGIEQLQQAAVQLNQSTGRLGRQVGSVADGLARLQQYLRLYVDTSSDRPTSRDRFDQYLSDDNSLTIIQLQVRDLSSSEMTAFVDDTRHIIRGTDAPTSVTAAATGFPFIFADLQQQTLPTVKRTSSLSVVIIFIVLITFFSSLRYGLTAFLTIVIGEIITIGMLALLRIPISSEMAGAVSMIMAVGDDFGVQVTSRFRKELRDATPEDAITEALASTMVPMSITTVGLLIGFRAMSLGQLTFLAALGNMLTIGVLATFLVAVTIIPVLLVMGTNRFGDQN